MNENAREILAAKLGTIVINNLWGMFREYVKFICSVVNWKSVLVVMMWTNIF